MSVCQVNMSATKTHKIPFVPHDNTLCDECKRQSVELLSPVTHTAEETYPHISK